MNTYPLEEKEHMIANCPKCRGKYLYSLKAQQGLQSFVFAAELLICQSCGFTIFVEDLKKILYRV